MKKILFLLIVFLPCLAQHNTDLQRPATYKELRDLSWGVGKLITDLEDSIRTINSILKEHEDYVNSQYIIQIENNKKDSASNAVDNEQDDWLNDLKNKGSLIEVFVYLLGTYITGHASLTFFKSKIFGNILVAIGNTINKGNDGKSANG